MDYIISQKIQKPLDDIFPHIDELKVVVLTTKDLKWAEVNAAKCSDSVKLLLQPEWDSPKSIPLIVSYIKRISKMGD